MSQVHHPSFRSIPYGEIQLQPSSLPQQLFSLLLLSWLSQLFPVLSFSQQQLSFQPQPSSQLRFWPFVQPLFWISPMLLCQLDSFA
jgi:hypothetical protein